MECYWVTSSMGQGEKVILHFPSALNSESPNEADG